MIIKISLVCLLAAALSYAAKISSPYQQTDISKIGSQKDIFGFLAGSAPYFSYPGNTSIPVTPPPQCKLQQVQLFARHGERYPSKDVGKAINQTFAKLESYNSSFKGPLKFLNDYQFFLPNSDNLELETTHDNSLNPNNPYLGMTDAQKHGLEFLAEYGDWIANTTNSTNFTAFTSSSRRVHDTAVYFLEALGNRFNFDLQIVPETPQSGANTLVPKFGCPAWGPVNRDIVNSFGNGFLNDITNRLQDANPGLDINATDAHNLFDWCAFEINARGYSEICDVFTREELINYSYQQDLNTYYSDFVGNPLAKAIGSVLFNATMTLLKQSEELDQRVWLSFTHDNDILNYLSAVGLFDDKRNLTGKGVPFQDQTFRRSWVVPMGARVYAQKYECTSNNNTVSSFVRYVVNDVVIPFDDCQSGPGFSCPFAEFLERGENRIKGINFAKECNTSSVSNVTSLTFYWDYKEKNYDAPLLLQ